MNLKRLKNTIYRKSKNSLRSLSKPGRIQFCPNGQNSKKVRKTIKDLGGTMPEDLPTPDKSIKQLKKDMKISNTESLIENK
jgi:DNA-damage-inducible protein D